MADKSKPKNVEALIQKHKKAKAHAEAVQRVREQDAKLRALLFSKIRLRRNG